jgi:dihydrofolate synthase/folylpolyglutamate synthase
MADERGAPMHHVPPEALRDVVVGGQGTSFRMTTGSWGELEVVTPLVGRHQATNAALAVAVCEHLGPRWRPGSDELLRGIADVRYHGRDEVRTIDGTTWLFDVAHNPAGMASLADTLDRLDPPRPRVALVGILADKDWRAMLPPLRERCEHVVVTQPSTAPPGRRWDPAEVVQDAAGTVGSGPGAEAGRTLRAVEDFEAALDAAASLADGGTVVVTGSVHTVGGAMRLLGVQAVE